MSKIKNFLFQNKKRKIITICSFVLAIVILLSAILIPAISNMDKNFKTEEEMYDYFFGTWKIDGRYYFVGSDGVATTNYLFEDYFIEMIKSAKDVEVIKDLTLESCEESIISELVFREVYYHPKAVSGHVYFKGLDIEIYIKRNNRIVAFEDGEEVSITKISDDISLVHDDIIEMFNDAKKDDLLISNFIPSFSELKELIKTDSKTSSLVNTTPQMSVINDSEDMTMFFLGNCTNAQQSSAYLSDTDDGIMLVTSDPTISIDELLAIIDVYLQDCPTYPGVSAHDEIKNEIKNGEVKYLPAATIINSEFTLYNIKFKVTYWPNNYVNNGVYDKYHIVVIPLDIRMADYF